MTQNPRPLSVGNVVSTGLVLYRSNLKTYLQLALYASLWSLVPIYGWAKASTIAGTVSRLAYGELISQPESLTTARSHLNPRMWDFFVLSLLVGLILGGAFFGFYIVLIVFGVFMSLLFGQTLGGLGSQNPVVIIIGFLLAMGLILAFLAAITWLYSRFMIAVLPLAVESNISPTNSISRSWELTNGSAWRMGLVASIAFLISLPLIFVAQIASFVLQSFLSVIFSRGSAALIGFSFIGGYILGSLSSIFIMPFWQSIKAVIYYDLRSRREGLGLQLRDRKGSPGENRDFES